VRWPLERAMRPSPRDHETALMLSGIATANLIAGRDEAPLSAAPRAVGENPRFASAVRNRIVALVHLGRLDEAKVATAEYLKFDPAFTSRPESRIIARWPFGRNTMGP
jgi:hypothetical protein